MSAPSTDVPRAGGLRWQLVVGWFTFPNLTRLILSVAIAGLVVYPFLRLVVTSFREGGPLEGGAFTLDNYVAAFRGSNDVLVTTLVFATGQTLVPLVIGVLLAWVVTRTDVPGRGLFEVATLGLYFIPLLAAAAAWSILLGGRNGMLNALIREYTPWGGFDVYSMAGMIFVQSLYLVPLVFLVVSSSMRSVDPEFESAARVFGASAWSTFLRITVGVCRPAVLSSAVLCFIIGLGSMEIPLLFGYPAREYVFTTDIYSALRVRFPPEYGRAAATGVLLLFASLLIMWPYVRSLRHSERYVTLGGKRARSSTLRLGNWRWPIAVACSIFFVITLVLPFVAVALGSLLPYVGKPSAELLSTSSLDNYRNLSGNPVIWRAVKNSLVLSSIAGIVVMLMGSLIAYFAIRFKSRWSRLLDYSSALPLTIPAVVLGTALLYSYITFSLPGGFRLWGTLWIMGMSYVVYFLPLAVRQMTSPTAQLSVDLEHASRVSGASQMATYGRITIPLLIPAFIGGMLLAFVTFLREFTTSVLLANTGTEVISTVMYSYYANGRLPYVAALSVGLWAPVIVLLVLARLLFRVRVRF